MLKERINRNLAKLQSISQLRELKPTENLIDFSSNNYFGLGFGAGASRYIGGNHDEYAELETLLANYYNKDAVTIFSSGYLANLGVITALAEKGDTILIDKLAHNSLLSGSFYSGASVKRFKHNNLEDLEKLLKDAKGQVFIITESVFSMDGDIADTNAIHKLAKKYNAFLIVDTAHSFGFDIPIHADVIIGTLSKAIGSLGGYVCAEKTVIDYIINNAAPLIYTTALPKAVLKAAIKNFHSINSKKIKLQNNKTLFEGLTKLVSPSIIYIVHFDTNEAVLNAASIIKKAGFFVAAIRPPTSKTPRLRITLNSRHTKSQITDLAKLLKPYIFAK
jgi:8-amino-7-oxononanoate synthase